MEDWDLDDHEKFLNLVTNKCLVKIYYEENRVTQLEPMKWVVGVEKAGLLNMLWVPRFSRATINIVCVCQFITLFHDACIWLGEPIPIINMLIHCITRLPYQVVDPTEEFGGKSKKKTHG